MAVKSGVLKRGYTYGEDLTSAGLSTQLQTLRAELAVLTRQSASATTRITAPVPGVFSSLVDGYESRLTSESVFQLTPSALQEQADHLQHLVLRRQPAHGGGRPAEGGGDRRPPLLR